MLKVMAVGTSDEPNFVCSTALDGAVCSGTLDVSEVPHAMVFTVVAQCVAMQPAAP